MTVKDGLNAEQVAEQKAADDAAREARRIAHERALERQAWKQLYHIYERCVEIADKVWSARLIDAEAKQRGLAEQMRDRGHVIPDAHAVPGTVAQFEPADFSAPIPVPLFTPRDRQQFLKEVAATLLISADRRQLTVFYPKDEPEV